MLYVGGNLSSDMEGLWLHTHSYGISFPETYSTDHMEVKRSYTRTREASAALVRLEYHNCVYYVYYVNHSQALLISTSAVFRVRVRIKSLSQLSCECEYVYMYTRSTKRVKECYTSTERTSRDASLTRTREANTVSVCVSYMCS